MLTCDQGIAFCEYKNAAESTDIAVDGLNDMELGDLHLRVKRASIGVEHKAADMSVSAMSAMAGSDSNGASHHGRVLCLLNMVTPEDLMDPAEADGEFESQRMQWQSLTSSQRFWAMSRGSARSSERS